VTQATYKQTSDENPTFIIRDPINKIHKDKNKSFISYASIKINLISNFSISIVCESARYYIVERVKFVVKIIWGIRVLTSKFLIIFISLTSGVWLQHTDDEITYTSVKWGHLQWILTRSLEYSWILGTCMT